MIYFAVTRIANAWRLIQCTVQYSCISFIELKSYFDHNNINLFKIVVEMKCFILVRSSLIVSLANEINIFMKFLNLLFPCFELFGIIGTLWSIIIIIFSKAICFAKTKHFYIIIFTADLIAIIWLNGLDKFLILKSSNISRTSMMCKLIGCVLIYIKICYAVCCDRP